MEIDRPTAADYAASEARGANLRAESVARKNKTLEGRVELLEAKVKGLFLVIDYMLDTEYLNRISFDEAGNIVISKDKGEDSGE